MILINFVKSCVLILMNFYKVILLFDFNTTKLIILILDTINFVKHILILNAINFAKNYGLIYSKFNTPNLLDLLLI